jgi:phosphoserine phosphatase
MVPPQRWASVSARADLPLAVLPPMTTSTPIPASCPSELPMPVVCLIADPAVQPLAPALVHEVARATGGEARWLAEGTAAEVTAEKLDADEVARIVADAAVDTVVIPAAGRRKKLLISDMDSTIITIECIDELADFAGLKAEVAAVTRRAMNGELDFVAALEARVALLAGLPEGAMAEVIRERLRFMPGAATLVRTMRAAGALTVLVSGGFTVFTRYVREVVGFHLDEANALEVQDGRLTGRLLGPIRAAEAKRATLERLRVEHGLERGETLAVGDGANDLPMIKAAGLGVAFRAHPRVRAEAPVQIDHGDLTALLYLQGYARDEFVSA